MKTKLPLPADPRHQRFADLVLEGTPHRDAYAALYPDAKPASRNPLAARLLSRRDVQAYMAAVRQEAAQGTVLSVLEKREFLARITRTPITDLCPQTGKNADLIKSYTLTESESGTTVKIERFDALKAIDADNKLSGDDPDTQTLASLAQALASLATQTATSPLPADKM